MKRWDWKAELRADERARLAVLDQLLAAAVASKPDTPLSKLGALMIGIRELRSERLVLANRGAGRARMNAGLANPSRKRRRQANTSGLAHKAEGRPEPVRD